MRIPQPGGRMQVTVVVACAIFVLAVACGGISKPTPTSDLAATPQSTLAVDSAPTSTTAPPSPTPIKTVAVPPTRTAVVTTTPVTVSATSATALQDTVNQYILDWQSAKYSDMYGMLSPSAKSAITETKFVSRYTNIAAGIDQISVAVLASPPQNPVAVGSPPTVNVPIHVTYKLAVLGDIEEDNQLPMILDNNTWLVAWTPGLIFKDLNATRTVAYDSVPAVRGSIFDRNGNVLAQDGSILTVGVVPGEIKDENQMLAVLSDFLKLPPADIKKMYADAQPGWFIPIKEVGTTDQDAAKAKLGNILGVSLRPTTRRVYPYGPASAHFVGYVSRVQAADLPTFHPLGYDEGDWVGRGGVESWGEQYLHGQTGATMAIEEQDGTVVRTIAQKDSAPGSDIYTSIDINYQIAANKILGTHAGSLIVMNPSDNTILAFSSEPSFDPNLFVLGMTDAQWQDMNAPARPLLYRPAQGLYPTGSIFKVITLAAGLEKGGFKPADTFDCGLDWKGMPGVVLHNWKAEGTLNLIQSLTGSCDPTFYTIGLKLSQLDPNILSGFARAFGLGQPTGASGIDEASGTVPDPAWKQKTIGQPWYDGDGVNLAIGQGYLLATPLQMANVFSTIANHGAIRTPILVRQIKRPDGTVVKSFQADPRGAIPVSPTNLGYIVEGMRGVTSTPLGTAAYAWQGSTIPMEAKTGSAENETSKAHAWFVGYTSPDHPTILTLVMLEGGELGGQFAAPLGRQIVEYAVAHPITSQ